MSLFQALLNMLNFPSFEHAVGFVVLLNCFSIGLEVELRDPVTQQAPGYLGLVDNIFLVIFLISTTSFAVALALGGGPRATTVELAIYQAFRFDFDLSRAALLGAVQLVIGGTAALVSLRLTLPSGFGAGLDRAIPRWDSRGLGLRAQDIAVIALACMFLLVPHVVPRRDNRNVIKSMFFCLF